MNVDKIISADDHVQETPDLWERRLPSHLREKAPKIIRLENGAAAWAWGTGRPAARGTQGRIQHTFLSWTRHYAEGANIVCFD